MAKAPGVSEQQHRLLARLARLPSLRGSYYLVGGTAVGWHFGHRQSLDLDLFSLAATTDIERAVLEVTRLPAQVRSQSDVMVGLISDGVPIDLVAYPYAPLKRPRPGPAGFPTASVVDLATMKLSAIAKRGLRRAFWDLHVILTNSPLTLGGVLSAYRRRFKRGAADGYHVLRALTYFADAERDDPRVAGLTAKQWSHIRAFFEREASAVVAAAARR